MAKRVKAGSLFQPTYLNAKGERVPSAVWWVKFYQKANPRPIRISTGTTDWEEAQAFLLRKMGDQASGKTITLTAERVRMSDLFQLLIEEYATLERRTLYDLKCKIKKRLDPEFGAVQARTFGSIHLKRYTQKRQAEKAEPASINRELAVVRRALRLGMEQDPPLVYRVPKFTMLPVDNVRQGVLDHEKYMALRDSLPAHLVALFVVAYHAGCRRGELLAVQWEHVDFGRLRIHMPGRNTKNRHAKFLPIYGEMRGYLEMASAGRHDACPFVFQKDGLPIQSFVKAWKTACALAGVPGLLFHDLRRTAITNMEHAGIPRSVAMAISGHLTESAYRRYLISNPKALDQAAETMSKFLFSEKELSCKKITTN